MRIAAISLVVTAAAVLSACGSGMPLSPSAMSSLARTTGAHDEAPPEETPPPTTPAPPAAATPLVVSIVGSIGTYAYDPNPLTATLGQMLMWTNDDVRVHHIVLEDGTDLGPIVPGASSAPVPLATESTSYYCLIHPSMVGTVNRPLPVEDDDGYPDYGGRAAGARPGASPKPDTGSTRF